MEPHVEFMDCNLFNQSRVDYKSLETEDNPLEQPICIFCMICQHSHHRLHPVSGKLPTDNALHTYGQ